MAPSGPEPGTDLPSLSPLLRHPAPGPETKTVLRRRLGPTESRRFGSKHFTRSIRDGGNLDDTSENPCALCESPQLKRRGKGNLYPVSTSSIRRGPVNSIDSKPLTPVTTISLINWWTCPTRGWSVLLWTGFSSGSLLPCRLVLKRDIERRGSTQVNSRSYVCRELPSRTPPTSYALGL